MLDRKKLVGSALAALLLAGGGTAVAISATWEPAPSGKVDQVAKPQTLGPQGPQTVSAIERPAAPPSAGTASELAAMNIKNAKLAREVANKRIYLGEMAGGLTCMSVEGSAGRITSTCQTLETITQGHLWLGIGGAAESADRVFGIAPDGVSTVLLTDDDGSNHRAKVANNVYVGPWGDTVARIAWEGSNGAKADLRLPPASRPNTD